MRILAYKQVPKPGKAAASVFLYSLLLTLYSLPLGCKSVAPPTPLSQLDARQVHGHDVFQMHCAQCHYDRVDEPLHGPALVGVFKKQYLHSGAPANDDRVTATVLHGRNLMPAQPYMDPDDMNDLLAYLHTL